MSLINPRLLALAWLLPPCLGAMTFSDITAGSGISYLQHDLPDSGPGSYRESQTYMSGGAAAGDYDNDGWVDLYVTVLDGPNILYRNKGDGTFEDKTVEAFGADHLSTSFSNGCAFGDLDNDGDLDLYVTSIFSPNYHLFINDGTGSFTEEAVARNAAVAMLDEQFGFSVTFGDYDLDGFLDIHVTEWRDPYQSLDEPPHNNRLLKNIGRSNPGHFTDVTEAAGVETDEVRPNSEFGAQGFSPRFSDLDRDGHPDLLLASDHRTSRLFWSNGDGTFTDGTEAAGVGTDRFGMGSALGDYDMDGDLDWFVTSIFKAGSPGRDGNRLYRYDGARSFTDDTDRAGVRDGQWGWAAAFADFDHDRDLDLIQTNGAHFPYDPGASAGYENDQTRLWENDGSGVFSEVATASGVVDTASGKGLLTFDFDRDGDLDVFIVNNRAGPVLYENTGADGTNWLIIRPEGRLSNRQGLGAFVTVVPEVGAPPLIREVNAGNNFLGQDEVMAHYGLGNLPGGTVHRVTIEWPGGATQVLENVPINQDHHVSEPLPVSPDLALSLERLPGGGLLFQWTSEIGEDYVLETCTNLAIPHWTPYHSVTAAGPTATCTMPSTELHPDGAYFRVVKLAD